MSLCILADANDIDSAKQIEVEYMSVDDLKKLVILWFLTLLTNGTGRLNKNQKLVKKLAKKHDAFLASEVLIKQIPSLLGPGLSKGRSPLPQSPNLVTNDSTSGQVPHSRFPL
jgi:large subunit ribosomal protein L10Ae